MEKIRQFFFGCYQSATMWFAVGLPAAFSWGLMNWDTIASLVLDPDLLTQFKASFGAYPAVIAWTMRVCAFVTFVSRARTVALKAAPR